LWFGQRFRFSFLCLPFAAADLSLCRVPTIPSLYPVIRFALANNPTISSKFYVLPLSLLPPPPTPTRVFKPLYSYPLHRTHSKPRRALPFLPFFSHFFPLSRFSLSWPQGIFFGFPLRCFRGRSTLVLVAPHLVETTKICCEINILFRASTRESRDFILSTLRNVSRRPPS